MENTQQVPHTCQTQQDGCMHEQPEAAGGHMQKDAGMTGHEHRTMGTAMPPTSQQFQGQPGGSSYQAPQMGAQNVQHGMAEQFHRIMGQPGGTCQEMPGSHHSAGETCSCQGNGEGVQYGEPQFTMSMAGQGFPGQQGMPQPMGGGQPHVFMNSAWPETAGQPAYAGPMMAPYNQIMQGMPFQGHAVPHYGQSVAGSYGLQSSPPGHAAPQYGPPFTGAYGPQASPQSSMPMFGHAPAYAGHLCSGQGHPGQGTQSHSAQHACHDQHQHQYGQLMDIVGDMMAGNPDVSKMMGFFQNCDTQFLKGVLIGAVGMFLLTNDTVKNTIVDMVSGVWGTFQKKPEAAEESAKGTKTTSK